MMDREVIFDSRALAALDKARDYDAASSYNFLNAELRRMCAVVGAGVVVAIEDEAGRITLRSVGEVLAWSRGRYPHAEPGLRMREAKRMEWLRRPLECAGVVVAEPLDPARIGDADLREVCFRMSVIFETIEMQRCEGRLMPMAFFDAIDTLESKVFHGLPSVSGRSTPPRLVEWESVIDEFGQYYDLADGGPIIVDLAIYRETSARYRVAQQAEPNSVTDRQDT